MKKGKIDWITLLALIIMIVGTLLLMFLYPCNRDPVKCCINRLLENDEVLNSTEYEYVEIKIYHKKEDLVPMKTHVVDLTATGNLY